MCDMTHSLLDMSASSHMIWLIQICDMTHLDVWHDSFICVTWLLHMCDMTHSLLDMSVSPHMIWLIQMCDMTHSDVWHDSFICVTWLIQMCDMTPSDVWHDSFRCVTWLLHMCDMTHSLLDMRVSPHITWLIQMCDMTHSYVWCDSEAASNSTSTTHSNVTNSTLLDKSAEALYCRESPSQTYETRLETRLGTAPAYCPLVSGLHEVPAC